MNVTLWTASGQIVRRLLDGPLATGPHEVVWDGRDEFGRDVASVVYLYRLTSGQKTLVRRMVLLR